MKFVRWVLSSHIRQQIGATTTTTKPSGGSMLTASKLQLAQLCQHWVGQDYSDEPGPAAKHGTAVHTAIEHYLTEEPHTPDYDVAILMAGWVEAWDRLLDDLRQMHGPERSIGVEVAIGWEPEAGAAVIGSRIGRDYPPGYPICGTADLVLEFDEAIYILDWKTGGATPAEDSAQLRFLAGPWLADGRQIVVGNAFIASDGRIVLDTQDHIDPVYDIWLEEILELGSKPTPGPHCRDLYCPWRGSCMVTQDATRSIVPAPIPSSITCPASLEAWLDIRAMVQDRMDELDRQAKALVDASGGVVSLPSGGAYKATTSTRTSIDTKAAKEALGDLLEQFSKTTEVKSYRRAK